MTKKQTRREAIKKTGAAMGSLAAGVLTLDLGQLVSQQARSGARPLVLKIKVPSNLKVETKMEPDTRPLALRTLPATTVSIVKPIEVVLDLTSLKTAEWINNKSVGTTSSSCTCCVRG